MKIMPRNVKLHLKANKNATQVLLYENIYFVRRVQGYFQKDLNQKWLQQKFKENLKKLFSGFFSGQEPKTVHQRGVKQLYTVWGHILYVHDLQFRSVSVTATTEA